jgi:hypothetical protein
MTKRFKLTILKCWEFSGLTWLHMGTFDTLNEVESELFGHNGVIDFYVYDYTTQTIIAG